MQFRSTALLAICVLSLSLVKASAQVAFDKPDFDLLSGPTLALDLNGDGITDLVVAVDQSLFIYLNPGDGTIGTGIQFPAGRQPVALTAGDFNGDGIADLAELSGDGTVTVLLGKGDGTFSDPISTASGASGPGRSMAASDFNGDGFADLAFTTFDGKIFVRLGNGDGTFNVTSFATGANQLPGLAAADFDGDGNVDLAVLTCCRDEFSSGDIQILFGHGDGTFGPLMEVAGIPGPVSITAAELNNDGHPDLLVTFAGCHTPCDGMNAFMNRGDGTFAFTQSLQVSEEIPSQPAVGDFNGDGIPDIAFSGQGDVHVYLGNGDGIFVPQQSYAKGPPNPFLPAPRCCSRLRIRSTPRAPTPATTSTVRPHSRSSSTTSP
jgi:hypothetical protein